MLVHLADLCYRRRWLVVLSWVVLLFTAIGLQGAFGGEFRADFSNNDSDSGAAFTLLEEEFPAQAGATIDAVYRADPADPATITRIGALMDAIEAAAPDLVESVTPRPGSRVPEIGVLSVQLTVDTSDDVPIEDVRAIVNAVKAANVPTGCVADGVAWVSSIADELLALDLGRVVTRGLPQDVLEHPAVVESYLGSDLDLMRRSGARS